MQIKQKLRTTRQREMILEEIKGMCTHPSADEIYDRLRKKITRISLGTIYRNLEILVGIGAIQKLDGPLKRYDGNIIPHYHVKCTECGKIEDVQMEQFHEIEESFRKKTNYTITGHNLDCIGTCPECQRL
ncbi:MAG: transcriptional repressor [Desulfobacterales bacterium]|nr:transcriptional repressor [Desulfobacterales bacterium]